MPLPLLLSVPHAGLRVPPEAAAMCVLTPEEIEADGDVGAREIYDLSEEVVAFATTEIARAIVDLNRPVDDRRKDGVVKTHTCWDVPVYREPLREDVVTALLDRYHAPYHGRLRELARSGRAVLGVDCHTMAALGPPVGPDPGRKRPFVCLSHANGTCPDPWIEALAGRFREVFGESVRIDDPFTGGYITRTHAAELPFVQLELSREPFMTNAEKRAGVLYALGAWCRDRA